MVKSTHCTDKERILYGGVSFGEAEKRAIQDVLDRNWWGLAAEERAFEQELAAAMGVKHAVFVSSGTAALEVGIAALRSSEGSEVIVPACAFPTPVASLLRCNLVPVLADIERGTNFINPESVLQILSDKTRAIMPVYVAGNVGALDQILEISDSHDLSVLEDNCDGLGGLWNGKMLGSFGTFSATSTHAAHIVSTGQGGVVFTDDSLLAKRIRGLRDWGRIDQSEPKTPSKHWPEEYCRYTYDELGYNMQPLELQAAMGRSQLRRLDEFSRRRKENFHFLQDRLQAYSDRLTLPIIHPSAEPTWFTYPLVMNSASERQALVNMLDQQAIDWRPILAGNLARQPAYADRVTVRTTLENADTVFFGGLWLPLHPELSSSSMERIAHTVCQFLDNT